MLLNGTFGVNKTVDTMNKLFNKKDTKENN